MKKPIVLIITMLMISMAIVGIFGNQSVSAKPNEQPSILYTDRNEINIDGNSGFNATNGVINGSGTENDPWIISDWKINSTGGHVIKITNTDDYFILQNCWVISYFSDFYNILFEYVNNSIIKNIIFEGNHSNTVILSNTDNIIVQNSVNIGDIDSVDSTNIIINNNTFKFTIYVSIYFRNVINLQISNNNIINGGDIYGIYLSAVENALIINNSISNHLYCGIYIDYISGYETDIEYTNNITIENNLIYDNEGEDFVNSNIYSEDTQNINIINNTIYMMTPWSSVSGIRFDNVTYSNISGNQIYETNNGLYFDNSTSINIENNIINESYGNGIFLYEYNEFINITNNTLIDNNYGINLYDYCSNNNINNNLIELNISEPTFTAGIIIQNFCEFNNIIANQIFDYDYGIDLLLASNNTIYLNHFNAVINAYDDGNNTYDNGIHGNYWYDWQTPDENDDGIVDEPYNITGGTNQDLYPLVLNWEENILPTANAGDDQNVNISTIVEFNGLGSFDSDGTIENWTWEFEYDGETIILFGETPEFLFNISGEYEVTLTVTDDRNGQDTDTVIIIIEEISVSPPTMYQILMGLLLGFLPLLLLLKILKLIKDMLKSTKKKK